MMSINFAFVESAPVQPASLALYSYRIPRE